MPTSSVQPDPGLVSQLMGPSGPAEVAGQAPITGPDSPPVKQPDFVKLEPGTFNKLYSALASYVASRRGDHWELTDEEADLLSTATSEAGNKLVGKMAQWSPVGFLLTALALVLAPRIMEDVKTAKGGKVQEDNAKQHPSDTRQEGSREVNAAGPRILDPGATSSAGPGAQLPATLVQSRPSAGLEAGRKGRSRSVSVSRRSKVSKGRRNSSG